MQRALQPERAESARRAQRAPLLLGAARRAARGSGAGLRPGVGGGNEGGSARALPGRPPPPLAPSLLPGRVARSRLDLLARPVRGLSGFWKPLSPAWLEAPRNCISTGSPNQPLPRSACTMVSLEKLA
ncbi:uncharacterized protein LOC121829350 [Peromyscus maniculatus bairdii]|uniref:uncharacterized protein LOC121829350 n=1 Tax=Peromyscus maniculatus bairdii TaxID=230844 RepID=UPI003FD1B166